MSGFNEPSSGRYIVAIGSIALRAVTERSWRLDIPIAAVDWIRAIESALHMRIGRRLAIALISFIGCNLPCTTRAAVARSADFRGRYTDSTHGLLTASAAIREFIRESSAQEIDDLLSTVTDKQWRLGPAWPADILCLYAPYTPNVFRCVIGRVSLELLVKFVLRAEVPHHAMVLLQRHCHYCVIDIARRHLCSVAAIDCTTNVHALRRLVQRNIIKDVSDLSAGSYYIIVNHSRGSGTFATIVIVRLLRRNVHTRMCTVEIPTCTPEGVAHTIATVKFAEVSHPDFDNAWIHYTPSTAAAICQWHINFPTDDLLSLLGTH